MVQDRRNNEGMLTALLLGAWGCYQVAAGLYFIFLRPSFLPEDLRASSTTLEAVQSVAPEIEVWLDWVFAVLGGQMAASGVLLLGAAVRIHQSPRLGPLELGTYVAAGIFSVSLMSGVNFALGSDFRWLLVVPVLIWIAGIMALCRQASKLKD